MCGGRWNEVEFIKDREQIGFRGFSVDGWYSFTCSQVIDTTWLPLCRVDYEIYNRDVYSDWNLMYLKGVDSRTLGLEVPDSFFIKTQNYQFTWTSPKVQKFKLNVHQQIQRSWQTIYSHEIRILWNQWNIQQTRSRALKINSWILTNLRSRNFLPIALILVTHIHTVSRKHSWCILMTTFLMMISWSVAHLHNLHLWCPWYLKIRAKN